MGVAVLARELLGLRQKALGLTGLGRVGSDAAGLGPEAVLIVGAHDCTTGLDRGKSGVRRPWCRLKPSKAKALRKIAARAVQKQGAARGAPNQCADNNNFENMGDVVPCSFILPSALPDLSALPTRNAARRPPA
ncbi:hypothetical protein CEV34_4928 [Brucella pseudogrignonensis]|uniref:Uncharacterized protein n=1 Tax=Brucella pseudogrignonensis TaxID=419475 RepID=A0A256G3C4_9HYPH|nr:hypothetical protein CEV34_4928 [Brucella pseudogrignonensis]